MPETVSTVRLCCLVGYAALDAYARGGTAISFEAQAARKAATAVIERAELSQALFGDKATAISQLMALANECAEKGWDGDEAEPVDRRAVFIAKNFVRTLPDGVPLPEFAPELDGAISLDWIQSRNRLFTLSIGQNNRLAYAWLDGADKGHGVARFDGERIPARVLEGIRGIIDHGNPTIRTS